MKIAIGADHAGFEYKKAIIEYLELQHHTTKDFGTYSNSSCDYPDYVHPLAEAITNKEFDYGIVICGSGMGVSISANKHPKIRCAVCWIKDIAILSRQHNNANIIAIPARFLSKEYAFSIIDAFLNTEFEGGRHQKRIDKIELK